MTFATRFLAAYLFVKVKGSRPMTYQHLTLEMLEKARSNGGFIDQKMFKTAQTYSFDSLLLEPADLELIEQYRQYVRPLLNPKCDYLLVTRNGTQYSKLCDLLSKQVFEAIGKHIHPTRYRQIIETESASRLDANEQQVITEDQKHSSRVAKLHYQKRRSRDVATRAQVCMQKLRGEVCRAGREVQKCLDLHNDVNNYEGRASDSDSDHPCSTVSDGDDDDDDHGDDDDDDNDNGDADNDSDDNGNNHNENINDHNDNDDHDSNNTNNINEHNDNDNDNDDHDDNNNDQNDNDRSGNDRSGNQIITDHSDNNRNHKRRTNASRKLEMQVGHRLADSDCRRKSVLRFTSDEDKCLKRGLVKHGFGRWKSILEDPKLTFQRGRTTDSIKKRAASACFRQRHAANTL